MRCFKSAACLTAETVLREAKVPVIVVRERERERIPVHS